jgi:Putative transposase DNA-binding domain
VEVCPRNTSQNCSRCGNYVPKALSCRTHTCPYCGLILHRDKNAAENIRKKGRDAAFGERAVVNALAEPRTRSPRCFSRGSRHRGPRKYDMANQKKANSTMLAVTPIIARFLDTGRGGASSEADFCQPRSIHAPQDAHSVSAGKTMNPQFLHRSNCTRARVLFRSVTDSRLVLEGGRSQRGQALAFDGNILPQR